MNSPTPTRQVYSVSELAEILRGLLEDSLPTLWVQGELSNFRNPAGHWYFTLKDSSAQLPCVMFKGKNYLIRPVPKDGEAVLVRGQLSYYAPQGKAQLIVEHLEPAGEGALLREFEALKKKLASEGLFEQAIKRPIPHAPRGIGVITSGTGAALQDILTTLRRRYPLGSAYVYPVPVQGDGAAPAVIRALKELPKRADVDVVILARGGGSLEDLWCFNDEGLARAIRACTVPVVTGIGHETDFTIADFVADLRAPTPTAAAERVTPDVREWREHLDELEAALAGAMEGGLQDSAKALTELGLRLSRSHPGRRLQMLAQRLDEISERLGHAGPAALARLRGRLESRSMLLESLNPRAILQRGYAIARTAKGKVVTDATTLGFGDAVEVVVAKGEFGARVTDVKPS